MQSPAEHFQTVVNCERCTVMQVLRDHDFNIPQPGFVGHNYWSTRVLLVGQNPGNSLERFGSQDRLYADALRAIGKEPSARRMNELQMILERIIPTWPVSGSYFPLRESGLSLQDISYCNLVRCRTSNNKKPGAGVVAQCTPHFVDWIDWLQPHVVVCIGKWAYDQVRDDLTARDIRSTFVNRAHDLNRAQRAQNLAEVAAFVRSVS